jgi:ubiquinone/menaquinone biosynthesis C-methylase UbiE
MEHYDFYLTTIQKLMAQGILNTESKVLVVCGGPADKEIMLRAGLKNVTISNIDPRANPQDYLPFTWNSQDVENLTYADDTFDFGMVHSGLHHCASPHKGLLELFRVCRQGVLVFEPKDNPLVRLGVKFGFGQEYEVEAVAATDCHCGGVRNSPIPNFVYRWTERDVIQTINCYAPDGKHKFIFINALRLPWQRLRTLKRRDLEIIVRILEPFLTGLSKIFPWFNNNFAFAVLKARVPEDIHPWLQVNGSTAEVNREWFKQNYANVK